MQKWNYLPRSHISFFEVWYMAMDIIIAVFAAFGLLFVLWSMLGFLLPGQKGMVMVYYADGTELENTIRYYCWLRDMGLLRCPLIVVDGGLTDRQYQMLLRKQGIEICGSQELTDRIEQERKKLG